MVNLDDPAAFRPLDPSDWLATIDRLPEQIESAWDLSRGLSLPASYQPVRQVLIAGMGDSALAGAYVQALAAAECPAPVVVQRNYGAPAWVNAHTLVIACSQSGQTEETLSAAHTALARGARLLVVAGGGPLAEWAAGNNLPLWRYAERVSLGATVILGLAALEKLGLLASPAEAVAEAAAVLRQQRARLGADSPLRRNPAKRLAGQFLDRLALVFGADGLEPVAWRWKQQLNGLAKALAVAEALPEADHNTLAGSACPPALVDRSLALFLRSSHDQPRNQLRSEATRVLFMTAGFNTDALDASGASPLAHMLTLTQFGDYVAYYLAMAYGLDPAAQPQIDELKLSLK